MRENLASKLAVADVASSVHISPPTSAIFQRGDGHVVMDYFTALRIDER